MSVERKQALVAAIRAELARELAAIERAAKDAWEGATHEENRPEHNKDMRSTEASYVAIGQSARARELAEDIAKLDAMKLVAWREGAPIDVGALVSIEGQDERGNPHSLEVFIVNAGGGATVGEGAARVRAVSPKAPLGEVLMGASEGEEVTLGPRRYEVVRVA
ncbi:MAG: hypothetical protein JNK05_41715 [Myxococcales bacterium]|nr:hypothetical protein [Myxococcales bacterium]